MAFFSQSFSGTDPKEAEKSAQALLFDKLQLVVAVVAILVAVGVAYFAGWSSNQTQHPTSTEAATQTQVPSTAALGGEKNMPTATTGTTSFHTCLLPPKVFTDTGPYMEVTGTLTGQGISPENTMDIVCEQHDSSCTIASLQVAEDPNLKICEFIGPITQSIAVITEWTPSEIVMSEDAGDFGAGACVLATITINRQNQTVEWVQKPSYLISTPGCKGADSATYNWMLESPPSQ